MIRNFKHPTIESSHIGDEIEDQDAIFKPWRNFSYPPNNIDEESEVDLTHYAWLSGSTFCCLLFYLVMTCYSCYVAF